MDASERELLRRLAREQGLDPEAVLLALGGGGGLPDDLAALLAELAGRLDAGDAAGPDAAGGEEPGD